MDATEIRTLQLDQRPDRFSTIRSPDQDFPVALVRNSIKEVGSHYGRHRQLSNKMHAWPPTVSSAT